MGVLKGKDGINFRRITSVVILALLMLLGYQAIQYKKGKTFNKLTITVHEIDGANDLLNKAQVLKIIRQHLGFDPAVSNLDNIDIRAIESRLERNLFVKNAIVFIDSKNELNIEVFQRKPIARVKEGKVDYYIAADGKKIPTSKYKTLRVPLISGHVSSLTSKTEKGRKNYSHMLDLLLRMEQSEFINALVEQIVIKQNGKLTMIPKIGSERIEFGDYSDSEEKLYKLEKYYEWGKNQDGWDKYAYLNLEFKDQITLGK